jgi:hypothetical protein
VLSPVPEDNVQMAEAVALAVTVAATTTVACLSADVHIVRRALHHSQLVQYLVHLFLDDTFIK